MRPRGQRHQGRWYPDSNLGLYYVLDVERNWIIETHVDLDAYGRELGVLGDSETVADD